MKYTCNEIIRKLNMKYSSIHTGIEEFGRLSRRIMLGDSTNTSLTMKFGIIRIFLYFPKMKIIKKSVEKDLGDLHS